jgi:DNA excision repair protein ERCC-2
MSSNIRSLVSELIPTTSIQVWFVHEATLSARVRTRVLSISLVKNPTDVGSDRPCPAGIAIAERPSLYSSESEIRTRSPFFRLIIRTLIEPVEVNDENSDMSSNSMIIKYRMLRRNISLTHWSQKQQDYQGCSRQMVRGLMTEESSSYTDFFPYPEARDGQNEMMMRIEESVKAGVNLCSEAPNGFGKTCVTLSGVLPWIKEEGGKLLYCARTHRQLDRVMEELDEISKNKDVSGVSFRGRRHMCLNTFVLENADFVAPISEVCGQLKTTGRCAFYENLRRAGGPEDLLEDMPKKVLSAPEIAKVASSRSLCPYELAKRLAKIVDVVALSYLYVFDPWILDVFIPDLETPPSKMILVEDEAHNVPATALESASDSLTIGTIRQALREATTYNDEASKDFIRALAKIVLELSSDMKQVEERTVDPRAIVESVIKTAQLEHQPQILFHMRDLGTKIRRGLLKAGKFPRSLIHRVSEFLVRWLRCTEREDYTFLLVSSRGYGESRRVSLDLVALDPTSVTENILKMVHSSIAISGTMSPLDAYAEMLGLGPDAVKATFQSPFARKNRLGLVVDGVDTSFQNRNKSTFRCIVEHCAAVANATPSNTGIFTSSYSVGKSLMEAGLEKQLRRNLFVEKPGMKGAENDKLIDEFKRSGDRGGSVLLGVQGGRNSEGGDFPGLTMESVVVVGVPYAKPTPRMEALISYYDSRFNQRGRDYAYVLPAMTRAIQAAGRPVRRLDDRGVIVLLDQRFGTPYLSRFIPAWLKDVTHLVPNDPKVTSHQVESFFNA